MPTAQHMRYRASAADVTPSEATLMTVPLVKDVGRRVGVARLADQDFSSISILPCGIGQSARARFESEPSGSDLETLRVDLRRQIEAALRRMVIVG